MSGETKAVLYEHPPNERLPFRTTITPASRQFSFSIAMQPEVYDGSMPVCGDGVEFRLEVRDSTGRIASVVRPLYRSQTQPGGAPLDSGVGRSERVHGADCGAAVHHHAGTSRRHLRGLGRLGRSAFQWRHRRQAGCSRRCTTRKSRFTNTPTTFRARPCFPAWKLRRMTGRRWPGWGLRRSTYFKRAVVSSAGVDLADLAAIRSLNSLPPQRVRAARILFLRLAGSGDRRRMRNGPSLLVLNDSDYPGWKVYVDGRRVALDHGQLPVSRRAAFAGQAYGSVRVRAGFVSAPAPRSPAPDSSAWLDL